MRPKVTKTKDYTQKWAEYTINHRPISVQRMLANPSIRTVLSRTGCSIDVQSSRTSNHLVTAGVIDELAIIRVHVPDEITLDVLNSELENAFPAYRYRQQYRHQLPELVGQTKRLMSEYAKELTRMDQYTGEEISIPRSRQNGDDFSGHRNLQKRVHATSSKSVSERKPPAPIKYFSPGLNLHNVSQPSNVINDPIVTVVTDISTKCVDIYHEIIYESWPQSISFDENGNWPSFVSRTHLDYRCPSVESCNSLAISRQEEQSTSQVETPDKTDCLRNEHFYRSTVFNEYHCQQHHSNEPCTHAMYPELTVEVSTTFNHGSSSRDQKLLEKYVNGKVVDVVPWYFDTALLQTSLTESASKSVPSIKDQFPPVRHRDQTVSHSLPVHTNTRSSFEETEVLSSMFGRTVVFWEPTLVLPSTQQSLVVSVAQKTTIEIDPLWSDPEEPYPRSLFLNEHSETITHQCLISVNDCDFLENKLIVNAQGSIYHSLDDPESDGLVTVTDMIIVSQYYGQPTSALNEYIGRFGSVSIVGLPILKGNEITIESNLHGQVTEIKDSSTSDVRVISVIKLSSEYENEGFEDELNEILDGEDVCAQWGPRMHPDMNVQDMTGTKNPQLTEAGAIQDCKRKSKSQVQAALHRTTYRRAPVTLGGNEEKNEIASQPKHYAIERIDRKPSGSAVSTRQSTGTVIRGKRIFIRQSTAIEHQRRQLLKPTAGQKIPTVGTTKKLTLASAEGEDRFTEVSKMVTGHKAKKAAKPDAVQQNVLAKTGKISTIQIAFINDEDFSDAGNPPITSDKNTQQTSESEDQTNSIQTPSLANDKRSKSDPATNHELPIPKQKTHHSEYLEYLENVIQHQALHTVKYIHQTDYDTREIRSEKRQGKQHKPKPEENQNTKKHKQEDGKDHANGINSLTDTRPPPKHKRQKSPQINVPDEFISSQAATIASVLARENTKEKHLTAPSVTQSRRTNLPTETQIPQDDGPGTISHEIQDMRNLESNRESARQDQYEIPQHHIRSDALHTVKYIHQTDYDTREIRSEKRQGKQHKPKPEENQNTKKHKQEDGKDHANGINSLTDTRPPPKHKRQKSPQINVPDEFISSQAATIASLLARENTKEKHLTAPSVTQSRRTNLPTETQIPQDDGPGTISHEIQDMRNLESNRESARQDQYEIPQHHIRSDVLSAPIQEGQKSSQINVPDEFISSQAATIASVLARENTKENHLAAPVLAVQGSSNFSSDFVAGEDVNPIFVPLRMQFKSSPDQCSLAVPVGPELEAATMEDQSVTSIANLDAGVQCSKSVFPVEESTISFTDSFSLMDKNESQKRCSEILLNLESFRDVLQVSPLQTPSHTPRVSLRLIRDVGTSPVALGNDTQIVIPNSVRSRVPETELPSNDSPNMPSPLVGKTASDTTSATHLSLISPSSSRDIPERHHTTVSDQQFVSSVAQGEILDSEFRGSKITSPHLQQPQSGAVTVVPEALKPRTHETSTVHGQWSTDGRLTRGRASTHEQQLQQTSHLYSPSSLGHKDHEMKRTELGTERGGRLSLVEPISKTSEFCLPMTDIHAQEHRFSLRSGGETLPLSDREMSDQEVVFCPTCQLSESKQSENGMYCGYRCPILLAIPSCTLTFTDSSHSEKTNDLKFAADASPQATTFVGHEVVAQSLESETAPLDEENSFMNSLMNVKLHDYHRINESISRSTANIATQEGRKRPIEILPKVSNSEIGNATQSDTYNVPMLPKTKSIAPSQSKIHATEFFDDRAHSNPDAEPSSTLVTVRSLLKSVPKNNTAHAELSPEGKLTTVATVHTERQPSLCDSIFEPLKSVREDPKHTLYTVSSATLPVQQPQVSNVMSNKIPNIPASLTSPSPDALHPKASNSVTFDITDSKTEKPQSEICTGKLDLSRTAIGSAQTQDRNIPLNQPGLSSNPTSSIESDLPALIHDIPLYTSSRGILPNCTRTTCPFLVGSSDHCDTVSHVQPVVKCGFPNIEKSKLHNNKLPSPTIGIPCFLIMDALLELTDAMADPEYQVARVEQSAAPGLIRSNNSEIGSHLADQRGYVILKGTYIPPKSVWNQCWEKTVTTGMARTFLCNLRPSAALRKAPSIFSGRGMVFDHPPLSSCPVEGNHGTKRNPSNLEIKDKECTKFPEVYPSRKQNPC
ncbi:hypothetical protein FGIG_10831 [Fasciola gigantica]|uniref:Uncharacterized protein n=1 Tax=Fasciola gigantica TaxID=46835 RepID=A0A504ZCB2_FASGI|nr:hypothetical protein FGIG_10831 [Fasciola gigantica]